MGLLLFLLLFDQAPKTVAAQQNAKCDARHMYLFNSGIKTNDGRLSGRAPPLFRVQFPPKKNPPLAGFSQTEFLAIA
jgi:hypothetical protein